MEKEQKENIYFYIIAIVGIVSIVCVVATVAIFYINANTAMPVVATESCTSTTGNMINL